MKPWQTPLYGGMSEASARKSYEAWIAQGSKPLPIPPLSDEEIARIRLNVEILLKEYAQAVREAGVWWRGYKARQPKGFRATRAKSFGAA